MWFELEAASCIDGMGAYKKYCKELSTFNVRVLNVPQLHYFDRTLVMSVFVFVELGSIDDLIRLRDSLDISLILREDNYLIEIYDDWRE
jgi:hypothetical protein